MSRLRGFIRQALSSYSKDLPEYLPENYLVTYKLPTIHEAIWTIHFPKSQVALKHARRRFIYEEIILFQLKTLHLRTEKQEATVGNAKHIDSRELQELHHASPCAIAN